MVRAICHWCSVRSELGQYRISRDIFNVVIDPHKPDADLYHFYNEWADVYQQLYGARPPSDEMRASIYAHFLEQCRKPSKLDLACKLYDMSRQNGTWREELRMAGGADRGNDVARKRRMEHQRA
eukprot:7609311-Pyramimonas_sp.AAC.1